MLVDFYIPRFSNFESLSTDMKIPVQKHFVPFKKTPKNIRKCHETYLYSDTLLFPMKPYGRILCIPHTRQHCNENRLLYRHTLK